MATTVALSDDVHHMIVKRQMEIFQEKGNKIKISTILEDAVRKGIDLVEK